MIAQPTARAHWKDGCRKTSTEADAAELVVRRLNGLLSQAQLASMCLWGHSGRFLCVYGGVLKVASCELIDALAFRFHDRG